MRILNQNLKANAVMRFAEPHIDIALEALEQLEEIVSEQNNKKTNQK